MTLKIITSKEFESEIKKIVAEKREISMIDAILFFCEERKIEIETAAGLVTTRMKTAIEAEAIKSRMLKNNKARLPLNDE